MEFQSYKSTLLDITCGVPQGSILGPLLYLLYVNDIPHSCEAAILSFADDITLFVSNPDIESLFSEANLQINKLVLCKSIVILQKRALRTIHNAQYNIDTEPLLKAAGILKIADLYVYQRVLFM